MTAVSPYLLTPPGEKEQALMTRIHRLREEKNAVILAHYYTVPGIQDVADVVGDSLALARAAAGTDADIIVFAGVYFMAETASILNPGKCVVMPDVSAGCPLADSCPADEFRAFRRDHPEAFVVSYINSSADIKAESDVICTSSNALDIVRQIPADREIIFGPDRNLGGYVSQQLRREMLLWQGACYVHDAYRWQVIEPFMSSVSGAAFIAHPECRTEVLDHADFVGSTGALLSYTEKSDSEAFVVATEPGILYEMKKRSPGKVFYPAPKDASAPQSTCVQMKQNTLENLCAALEDVERHEVRVASELAAKALKPIELMLEMSH